VTMCQIPQRVSRWRRKQSMTTCRWRVVASARLLVRRLFRALLVVAVGVLLSVLVTVSAVCLTAGASSTFEVLARRWGKPTIANMSEFRWTRVPYVRLTTRDREDLCDTVLDRFLSLVESRLPSGRPIRLRRALPWRYHPDLANREFEPVTTEEILAWASGTLPPEPMVQIGPVAYSPQTILVSSVYWVRHGRLGIDIEYRCTRRSGTWSCVEESRYAVHWPKASAGQSPNKVTAADSAKSDCTPAQPPNRFRPSR
jgi:hypothetical protein